MTEKEKMIEIISDVIWRYEPLLKYEPTPAPPDVPSVPEAIADALFVAGFRDVDERGCIFMNGEAIVPTPDIYNKVAELLGCPLISGVLPDKIEEQKMNNNKDLPDSIQCLKYMIDNYNLTDKERQAVDCAFRLFIEKRLSGFDLVKASDIDAGEEVLPCPFCGSTEMVYKKYQDPRHYPFGERWAIFCTGCLAEIDCGWAQKPSAILQLWNRRAKTESNNVEDNKDEADNS